MHGAADLIIATNEQNGLFLTEQIESGSIQEESPTEDTGS